MYLPAFSYLGPIPLGTVLLLAALAAGLLLASRLDRTQKVTELLWSMLIGGALGDKAVYIFSDLPYYMHHLSHLLFTPMSAWGIGGMIIGALIGLIWVYWRYRRQWHLSDIDTLAMTVAAMLLIRAPGQNLVGIPAPNWPRAIAVSLDGTLVFPSYALWAVLLVLVLIGGGILYRHWRLLWPGATAGAVMLGIAIAWLATSLTLPTHGVPFTLGQWLALAAAVAGFRLMTPATNCEN
ncbi:MAG: hypothetical protein M1318_04920 [Firmicutes bacterium]|jgi:hypothetical protein|nr:hypothetical protein [Bacillota bacterium]